MSGSASSMESYPDLETAVEAIVFNIIDSFRKRSVEGETDEVLDKATWARRVIDEVKKFPSEIVPTNQKEKILTPYLMKSGGQDVDYRSALEEGVVKEAEQAEALKREKKKLENALKKTKADGADDKKMVEALRQEIKGLTSEGAEAREKIREVTKERLDVQAEVFKLREDVESERKRADEKGRELSKIHETVVKKKKEFIEEMWVKMQNSEDLEIYMAHFNDRSWATMGRGIATLATQLKERMREEGDMVLALLEGAGYAHPFIPETPWFPAGGHACNCEAISMDHIRRLENQQSKIDLLEKHLAKAKAEGAENTDEAIPELSAQLDKALEDLQVAIEARSASEKARDESLAKGRKSDKRIRMLQAKALVASGTSSPFSARTPGSASSQALGKQAGKTLADELDGLADDDFVDGSWSEEAIVLRSAFEQATADNIKLEDQVRDLEAQVLDLQTRIGEADGKDTAGESTPTVSPHYVELRRVRNEVERLENEIKRLNSLVDPALHKGELDSRDQKIRHLEAKITSINEESGRLNPAADAGSKSEGELESFKEKLASSEEDLKALGGQLVSSHAKVQLLEAQIDELKGENGRIASIADENSEKEEELEALREKLASSDTRIQLLVAKFDELKGDNGSLPSTASQHSKSEVEVEALTEEFASSETLTQLLEVEIEGLKEEIGRLTSLAREHPENEEELSSLREQLASENEASKKLRDEIEKLEKDKESLGAVPAAVAGKRLWGWESKCQAEAERVHKLENLLSGELEFHEALQPQLASVDALTSGGRDAEAGRLRRWGEARERKAAQEALMGRIDAGEDELVVEWMRAGNEVTELEESAAQYEADVTGAWDKLLEASREKRRFIDEARRRLKKDADGLGVKKSKIDLPVAPLPHRLWSQLVPQSALNPLLDILTPHLDLYHRLSELSLLSFLYLTQWHAKVPFHNPFPRLRAKDVFYIFCYAAALTTLQTYVSARRERNLWLTTNSRLTAAYVHDLQHEAPYLPWLWNVDPRLMIWGQGVDPRMALAAGGVVWGAVAPALGLFDGVAWGFIEKVVGPGPLGLLASRA